MTLTTDQTEMFDRACAILREHGTGEFRKDLPKALRLVGLQSDETDGVTPLQGLVLGAAARRLDEIARDGGRAERLAAELRQFRHTQGG